MAKKKAVQPKSKTEAEGFEEFLKGPCPICGKQGLVRAADLAAGCPSCKGSFVYGAAAARDEMARLKDLEDRRQKDIKRRTFVNDVSSQFIQDFPASELAIEVAVSILAKLIHHNNKNINGSEIQAKVNDISDLIGTETFKLYHKKEGDK